MPPICLAAYCNRLDVVAAFLEDGADPDSCADPGENPDRCYNDDSFLTPLMYAAREGNLPMVELLLSYGCDVNKHIEASIGVLHVAARDPEDVALWQRLLDAGADPNFQTDELPPLHRVAHSGSPDILRLLLSAGADINALDSEGNTVLLGMLHFHILHSKTCSLALEVVRILLQAGVDVTCRNSIGLNALMAANLVESSLKDFPGQTPDSSKERSEALQEIMALIRAEYDRRRAAVLSVLPNSMPPEASRQVLQWARLMKRAPEEAVDGLPHFWGNFQ